MGVTASQLNQLLREQVPPCIGEHLDGLVTWHIHRHQVTALLPNPVWHDVFRRHAMAGLEQVLAGDGLTLDSRSDAEIESRQSKRATWEHFLHDPGNELALSACRRVIDAPGLEHNPLYLHGPGGCGKTHLMQAVADEFQAMLGNEAVLLFTGDDFVNRDAHLLAKRRASPLRERIEAAVMLGFDGIEALSGRSLAQEELFHLLNGCLDQGQQVMVTGRLPPQRMTHFEERLSTRLSWGLAVGIEPPHIETRLALLRQLCGETMDDIDPRILPTLIDNQAPDMHGVVTLAERILRGEDLGRRLDASFDRILSCVSTAADLRPGDIIGKRRSRHIAQARQTALLLARRLTSHKLESLGALVGGRDHSTVIYSLRQAEERLDKDPVYARLIRDLTQRILEQGG